MHNAWCFLKQAVPPMRAFLASIGALKRWNLIFLQTCNCVNCLQYIDLMAMYRKQHNKHKLQCLSLADNHDCLSDEMVSITGRWRASLPSAKAQTAYGIPTMKVPATYSLRKESLPLIQRVFFSFELKPWVQNASYTGLTPIHFPPTFFS